jgi:hypothetical protein
MSACVRRRARGLTMVALLIVGASVAGGPAGAAPAPADTDTTGTRPGLVAGVAVFDRAHQRFLKRDNADKQFRSASLVKVLIAVDHLWDLGPDHPVPPDDRAKLDLMLRSSDDAVASEFWARNGRGLIVERMAVRLGLPNTTPPPAGRTGWGSTGVSAADLVRVYRYVLDEAPAPVRTLVMDALAGATRCGTDGFDQSFGLRSAFRNPTAVKQGWVNFGDSPRHPCTAPVLSAATRAAREAARDAARDAAQEDVDYASVALHTTGTVGENHRTIVVVLSTHPAGSSFAQAGYALTNLTRALPVPGKVPAPPLPRPEGGLWFGTWSSGVAVHAGPATTAAQVGTVPASQEVRVTCQVRGEEVVSGSTRNEWWTYLPDLGGYMSNIYFEYPDNQLPSVPVCA